jgi:hypothetical protein
MIVPIYAKVSKGNNVSVAGVSFIASFEQVFDFL